MYRTPAAAAPRVCRGFSCALGRGPRAQPGFPFSLLSSTVESTVAFSDWASRCSVVFWSQKKTSRFPFPPGAPPTGTAAVGGGVSLGGMCPASEALVTAGVRAPTQPIPSVCSWGTLRPRLHRRAPRWSCPTRPASRGGVTLSGASPVPKRRPGLPRQWGPQPRAGLWKPSWSASLPHGGVVTDTSSPPGFRGAFASPAPRLPRNTAVPLLLLSGSVNCLCSDIKNVRFLCE